MPRFSIIIPVYRAEAFLRQCLDSVLTQSFCDYELIAVDDGSPDGSGAILAEYERRDSRVRTVTLAGTGGAGRARNAGLDEAAGEYVWFLDSDDWIEPGSLSAISDRLDQTGPDVLIFRWVRSYPNGGVKAGSGDVLITSAPDVFEAHEWPKVIDILHVPWNKVVRRELLERLSFRFDAGLYQDVSFTYPVLSAAARISTLDRVCVNYRQHDAAVTRTRSDRHFAVFDHWDRTFDLVEKYSAHAAELRPALFRRMIWHYVRVLKNPRKLTKGSASEFFARSVEKHRRYAPVEGYSAPGGVEGLSHRMIALGWYEGFQILHRTHMLGSLLKRSVLRTPRVYDE